MVTDNDCSGGYSAHGVSGQGGWNGQGHAEPLCAAGLSSNPQCCQVDVGGVLDLTCQTGESACHISQFRTSLTVVQRLVTHTTSMNSSRPAPPSVARHNAAASLWYVHVVLVLVEPTANHSLARKRAPLQQPTPIENQTSRDPRTALLEISFFTVILMYSKQKPEKNVQCKFSKFDSN